MRKQNYAFVQALRGIAALWVVLFHAHEGGHIPHLFGALPHSLSAAIFEAGHLGVAIFFTLSGFVIAHSLSNSRMTIGNWGRFMLRRSIRLDPAYWASIIVVLAFGLLSAMVRNEPFALPGPDNVVAHLLYLQVILAEPAISPVYWTLTYEIQFYAFFAAAMMVPRHMWWLLPVALLSALVAFNDLMPGIFLGMWASFFIGVLAHRAVEDDRWLVGLAILGAALAWGGSFGAINLATALALYTAVRCGWAVEGMNWRWLQFLGTVSYSLYLIHNPVSGATGYIVHRLLGSGLAADLTTLLMILVASVFAAWLLWFAVERPTQRWSKNLLRGPKTLATAT